MRVRCRCGLGGRKAGRICVEYVLLGYAWIGTVVVGGQWVHCLWEGGFGLVGWVGGSLDGWVGGWVNEWIDGERRERMERMERMVWIIMINIVSYSRISRCRRNLYMSARISGITSSRSI